MASTGPPAAIKKERMVTAAFFFLSGILTATWSCRIPDVQQHIGANNRVWGSVLFAIPAGLVAGLGFASWLIARYGVRIVTLVSCLLIALTLNFIGMANTTWPLVAALFATGLARTVLNIAINTSAVEVQRSYPHSIISGFHGLWSMACFIAAGIGGVLITYSVPPSLHFLGISLIAAAVAVFLLRRKVPHPATAEKRPFFVKPDRYLFLLGLIALCSMLCEGAMFDWSVNYFEKVVQVKKSLVTVGYAAFIIAMATGRLFGDKLIAAFGVHRLLMANGALMVVGFAVAATFPVLLPAAGGFLLIGIGDATLVPIIYMLASKSKIMLPTYALSSVTLIGYTGFLAGPLVIGNVSQTWGMQTAYFVLSVVSVAIIFLAYQIKNTEERSVATA